MRRRVVISRPLQRQRAAPAPASRGSASALGLPVPPAALRLRAPGRGLRGLRLRYIQYGFTCRSLHGRCLSTRVHSFFLFDVTRPTAHGRDLLKCGFELSVISPNRISSINARSHTVCSTQLSSSMLLVVVNVLLLHHLLEHDAELGRLVAPQRVLGDGALDPHL